MLTPDALKSEVAPYKHTIWRVVEAQWMAATMRITDSLEEQAVLEEILDETKPPMPPDSVGFNFLIASPFRYTPYPVGSRFRRANQPDGVFYGSETPITAIVEMAFYRLLFFVESPQTIFPEKPVQYTTFSVLVETDNMLDLTIPPLDSDSGIWKNLTDYTACQDLADAARTVGIEAIRYTSVRDPEDGINIAILALRAFSDRKPSSQQTWHIFLRPGKAQVWCEHPAFSHEYPFECFAEDHRIANFLTFDKP